MTTQYDTEELKRLMAEIDRIEGAPLADRVEARGEYLTDARENPTKIGLYALWMLQGTYGQGAAIKARGIVTGDGNRTAQLGKLVAQLEWQCPARMARQVFNTLSPTEQERLTAALQGAISDWEECQRVEAETLANS